MGFGSTLGDPECDRPSEAIATLRVLIGTLARLETQIAELDTRIARCAKQNDVARQLMTVPSIGSLIAAAPPILFQVFSKTVIGLIFFEFVQRKGDDGFGEGNFKALFESIEADQIERGVLNDQR